MAPTVVQWIVDTRLLWQVPDGTVKEQMREFEQVAVDALALLQTAEQKAVLRYYHVKDAKLSLASHLLKHLAITKLCEVPWSESTITRDAHGKPCYHSKGRSIDFNVSHQAGLVTLIACVGIEADVGTDVVCVNERNEYVSIDKDGLFAWIDIHAEVFAPSEIQFMKLDSSYLTLPLLPELTSDGRDAISSSQNRHQKISWTSPSGQTHSITSDVVVEAKLRRFYAFWCLREAYVKMTGEAFLADWLKLLEFREVRVPKAAHLSGRDVSLSAGEVVEQFQIYFKGKQVQDVIMEMRAFGQNFMVASCIRERPGTGAGLAGFRMPGFTMISLEDILSIAQPYSS